MRQDTDGYSDLSGFDQSRLLLLGLEAADCLIYIDIFGIWQTSLSRVTYLSSALKSL